MPVDLYDDDDPKSNAEEIAGLRFKDFDCPDCNANNPCDPPIGEKDEVLCNYCGTNFLVRIVSGRLRLKEQ